MRDGCSCVMKQALASWLEREGGVLNNLFMHNCLKQSPRIPFGLRPTFEQIFHPLQGCR